MMKMIRRRGEGRVGTEGRVGGQGERVGLRRRAARRRGTPARFSCGIYSTLTGSQPDRT